jgi:N-glycosylase/DNA lyase
MTSSPVEVGHPLALDVKVTKDTLIVDLADGRTLSVPVSWYPRLAHGTAAEQAQWELVGRGHGIHWPKLDEDIAVEDLLAGRRSGESPTSLKRWLQSRKVAG